MGGENCGNCYGSGVRCYFGGKVGAFWDKSYPTAERTPHIMLPNVEWSLLSDAGEYLSRKSLYEVFPSSTYPFLTYLNHSSIPTSTVPKLAQSRPAMLTYSNPVTVGAVMQPKL